MDYFGHVITPQGVQQIPNMIHAIKNYPIPNTATKIKGFLGLLGYDRRFIPNFAALTKPFTSSLKKDAKIDPEDPKYMECFEQCSNSIKFELKRTPQPLNSFKSFVTYVMT